MKGGSRGFIQNLFCKFWTFLQVSTNFGILNYFLLFKTIGKIFKSPVQCWVRYRPEATAHGAWRPAMRGQPTSLLGHGLVARSSRRGGPRRGSGHAPGVLTVWSPFVVRAWDGTVARSSAARWRLAGGKVLPEISRGPQGGVPGKEEVAEGHQNGGPTVRRRKWCWAAVFNGGGVASVVIVEGGGVL
jgi:hypothetical protein